jgi:hypothetical protein
MSKYRNIPDPVAKIIDELGSTASRADRAKLDLLIRTLQQAMAPAEQGGAMEVESMVASKTKNPVVIFRWGSQRGELSPIEARSYAMQILEASEAAVQDATVYRVIREELKLEDAQAFGLIMAIRNNRGKFEGSGE